MSENPQINLPPFCEKHNRDLVHRTGYKESDPWQALLITGQIVMFQAASASPSVHKRIGGDITRIAEIGCFACRLPLKFESLVQTARGKDLAAVKALGESWVYKGK